MLLKQVPLANGGTYKCGITEDQLLNVIVRGDPLHNSCLPTEPMYGIILQLYYFANEVSCSLHRRPNRTPLFQELIDLKEG